MNEVLSKVLLFAAGAAIGSAVTWKLIKTKYENLAREEIESVRESYYGEQDDSDVEPDNDAEDDESDEDRDAYEALLLNSDYIQNLKDKMNGSKDEDDEETDYYEEEEGDAEMTDPYVIAPEDFDENGYETVTLFYYADGVVATSDTNEVVENVDELIGEDSLNHFGEYEDDSVFVRNDNIQTDFEILKDNRRFSEVD